MFQFFSKVEKLTKQVQECTQHLLPAELQGLLKLISITSVVVRLLKFLNWLKRRIITWCHRHSSNQKEILTEQSCNHRHFDYTYIEGLIRELEDKIDRLKKENYSKAEILGHILVGGFGVFCAVVQMAWDSIFTKQKPKS